jgi:hypothetical protein
MCLALCTYLPEADTEQQSVWVHWVWREVGNVTLPTIHTLPTLPWVRSTVITPPSMLAVGVRPFIQISCFTSHLRRCGFFRPTSIEIYFAHKSICSEWSTSASSTVQIPIVTAPPQSPHRISGVHPPSHQPTMAWMDRVEDSPSPCCPLHWHTTMLIRKRKDC